MLWIEVTCIDLFTTPMLCLEAKSIKILVEAHQMVHATDLRSLAELFGERSVGESQSD